MKAEVTIGDKSKTLDLAEVSDGASLASPFDRITEAFTEVVDALKQQGYNSELDNANFDGTPARAAKALLELMRPLGWIKEEIAREIKKTFPTGNDQGELVLLHNHQVFGVCPHHLLPVIMRVSVGYIGAESGKVIGLSKLARIAGLLAGRPILQEQFTTDLADIFYKAPPVASETVEIKGPAGSMTEMVEVATRDQSKRFPFEQLETRGSIAYVEGLHMCMACRGAKASQARLVSNAVRGIFKTQEDTRLEAMNIITRRAGELL